MPCVKGAEVGTVLAETREESSSTWVAWALDIGTLPLTFSKLVRPMFCSVVRTP